METQRIVLQFCDAAERTSDYRRSILANLEVGALDAQLEITDRSVTEDSSHTPTEAIIEFSGEAMNMVNIAGALGTAVKITRAEFPDMPTPVIQTTPNAAQPVVTMAFR